ncbi:hypothetical protein ACJBSZ_11300, partial [Streptococcus suis]
NNLRKSLNIALETKDEETDLFSDDTILINDILSHTNPTKFFPFRKSLAQPLHNVTNPDVPLHNLSPSL